MADVAGVIVVGSGCRCYGAGVVLWQWCGGAGDVAAGAVVVVMWW